MKFLKFYIDSEEVDKKIPNDINVKDIRFIKAEINENYNEVEITCVIESDDINIDNKDINCSRVKLGLDGSYIL